jgi:Ion channel
MTDIWTLLRRFWNSDRGLSVLLPLVFAMAFVVPALELVGRLGRLVLDVAFTLILLAGVATVSRYKNLTVAVGALSVVALAIRWGSRLAPTTGHEIATALSTSVVIATLAAVTLAQVLRAGPVNRHRILGAIAVYLLFGLTWASAYEGLALAQPGAFSSGVAGDARSWVYFSFITLTTTGYGDIAPVSAIARSLAVLEAMVGQLYVAILISRLVGLQIASASKI